MSLIIQWITGKVRDKRDIDSFTMDAMRVPVKPVGTCNDRKRGYVNFERTGVGESMLMTILLFGDSWLVTTTSGLIFGLLLRKVSYQIAKK